MALPAPVLRRAGQRHGLVSAGDLRRAGVGPDVAHRLLAAHQLVAVHHGVYRVAGAPETWEQRQLAACMATHGVASHRAAARVWELDLRLDPVVEVSVPRTHAPKPDGVIVHRSRDLASDSAVTRHDGIPATTPLRMLVDLGAVTSTYWVARALEKCVVSKLVTVSGVQAELGRVARRGRRGAGTLRQVLGDWPVGDVRPDSVLEPAFARLARRSGLPQPVFQFEVIVGGRRRRLDFAYPAQRLAIEVDGFATRVDRRVFQEERWRQNELVQAGWRVVRFTWADVLYRPKYVAATLAALLGKLHRA